MQNRDTSTPADGASLGRRGFIGMVTAGAAATFANLPAAIAGEAHPRFDLQHWLDTSDPTWVAFYHAIRLAEAMGRADPTRLYRFEIKEEAGFALVVGDARPDFGRPVVRVFVDDGPLRADDVTGTTAFADWEGGAA